MHSLLASISNSFVSSSARWAPSVLPNLSTSCWYPSFCNDSIRIVTFLHSTVAFDSIKQAYELASSGSTYLNLRDCFMSRILGDDRDGRNISSLLYQVVSPYVEHRKISFSPIGTSTTSGWSIKSVTWECCILELLVPWMWDSFLERINFRTGHVN